MGGRVMFDNRPCPAVCTVQRLCYCYEGRGGVLSGRGFRV